MSLDRRAFMILAASAASLAGYRPSPAEDDRAVFWRIETQDNARGTVFGYARTAAALIPDVVRDGIRMVEQSGRVVLDMNNVTLASVSTTESMPPLLPMLSRPLADELRTVLTAAPSLQAQADSMPGFLIVMWLYGEGQTKPVPSVGGVIMDRAKALHLPATTLLSSDDLAKLRKPADLVALNRAIDDKVIAFMLNVRRQVGPIGKHCETLYRERRGQELHQFTKDLSDHGTSLSQLLVEGDSAREMLLARLPAALSAPPSGQTAFCFMPIGVITGPDGLLATAHKRGMRMSALA